MYQINFALCLCYNPHHHDHHLHQHYHCAVIIIIVFFFVKFQSICLPTCPHVCVILCIHWLICLCTTLYKIGAKKQEKGKSHNSILFFFKGTSGQALQKKNPSWTCNFPFPVALLPLTINQVKMIIKHQSSILMLMKQRRRNMQLMKI